MPDNKQKTYLEALNSAKKLANDAIYSVEDVHNTTFKKVAWSLITLINALADKEKEESAKKVPYG